MISFLRGRIFSKGVQQVVLDVGGVGYSITMASRSIDSLGKVGDEVLVLVSMQVKEDGISLYGFAEEQERSLFEKLIAVSGVGPKAAMAALSSYDAPHLMKIIGGGNVTAMSKVPGIGKKTAERIVVDLKGTYEQFAQSTLVSVDADDAAVPVDATSAAEATEALISMGFTSQETELALKGYTGPDDASEIVRYALRRLGGY